MFANNTYDESSIQNMKRTLTTQQQKANNPINKWAKDFSPKRQK